MKKLDALVIKTKFCLKNKIDELLSQKRKGESHFVAVAFMLLIVAIIARAFKTNITQFMENIWKNVTDGITNTLNG